MQLMPGRPVEGNEGFIAGLATAMALEQHWFVVCVAILAFAFQRWANHMNATRWHL